MNKTTYIKNAKCLLRSVIKTREFLAFKGAGHVPQSANMEVPNIKNALSRISDPEIMQNFLRRKETVLRLLIPTNKRKWHNELRQLLHTQLN